jgi:hypothetical protein
LETPTARLMQVGGFFSSHTPGAETSEQISQLQNTMKSTEPKLYAGIDYEFRPESFWAAASDPWEAILRNVKGGTGA